MVPANSRPLGGVRVRHFLSVEVSGGGCRCRRGGLAGVHGAPGDDDQDVHAQPNDHGSENSAAHHHGVQDHVDPPAAKPVGLTERRRPKKGNGGQNGRGADHPAVATGVTAHHPERHEVDDVRQPTEQPLERARNAEYDHRPERAQQPEGGLFVGRPQDQPPTELR